MHVELKHPVEASCADWLTDVGTKAAIARNFSSSLKVRRVVRGSFDEFPKAPTTDMGIGLFVPVAAICNMCCDAAYA